MQLFTARQKNREKTGQAENKHFTEPPYTQVQINKQVLIVAEEAVLIQTLTLLRPICFFWKNSFWKNFFWKHGGVFLHIGTHP